MRIIRREYKSGVYSSWGGRLLLIEIERAVHDILVSGSEVLYDQRCLELSASDVSQQVSRTTNAIRLHTYASL